MRVEAVPAARRGRTGLGCATAFGVGMIVFLVVSLVAGAIFVLAPTGSDVSASFIHAQPGSLRWNTHDRLTILLLSVDDHAAATPQVNGMILASLDPSTRTATLLSLPPQLWVTIPGFGQGRLGEAYADGGGRLALYTTESVTHTVIPYYVVMDRSALQSLVDAMGGVNITVQRPLPASNGGSGQVGREPRIHAGPQEMDGKRALRLIEVPGTPSPLDTDRMERQQRLLQALGATALQSQNGFRIPTLVNSLSNQIPTNFPYDQVPELAHLVMQLGPISVRREVLGNGDGAVMQFGGDIVVPDWQRTASLAHGLIPASGPRHGLPVAVLNGSGVAGQAASLADWLRQAGMQVRHVGSAPSFSYAHTQVLLSPSAGAAARSTAAAACALLQVPLRMSGRSPMPSPVVVIIGHDYQDPNQN